MFGLKPTESCNFIRRGINAPPNDYVQSWALAQT